jgi:CRP/FNR family transcriptional regulator, polysaccharide utilization system transcription regulator
MLQSMMKKPQDITCQECPEGFQSFFEKLDEADIAYLNYQKVPLAFKKNEVLFEEGKQPQGIYCLRYGKVKIYKNSFDGREQITRIVFPGELMGLKAMLSGHPYSVSSAAMEEVAVCFINKKDFFQLMLKYPEFTRSIILSLSRLLEQAEFRMISLAHKPVRERLAETLLFLNRSFHSTAPSHPKPYLNLTRMDLANIIGTAPETVIRLLSEFRDSRLIEIRGRKIFLINVPRLKLIANDQA